MISKYSGTCSVCGSVFEPFKGILEGKPIKRFCLACVSSPSVLDTVRQRLKEWRGQDMWSYQIEGAKWLTNKRKGLLADDQGLGKTVQALAAVPAGAPLIIICPKVAKGVWEQHLNKLRPGEFLTVQYTGRGSFAPPLPGHACVINYDILSGDPGACYPGTCVILDEAHYVKNEEAVRHRSALALCDSAERVYLLTGTPLKSRPPDLWGVLAVADVANEAFGSRREFDGIFPHTVVKKGRSSFKYWGKPAKGVVNCLRRVMLRRLKVDVLKDLPPKRWDTLRVKLDPIAAKACKAWLETIYVIGTDLQDLTRDILEQAEEDGGALPGREQFSKACSELARCKLGAVIDEIEAHEESHPNDPLIVWSRHVDPLRVIADRKGWELICGETDQGKREWLVEEFQAGKLKGLALSIAAAGTAITLTACDRAIFLDRSWSPADNTQAEDRIHRIGQTRPCRYTDLVCDHVLDDHLYHVLADKQLGITHSIDLAATQ